MKIIENTLIAGLMAAGDNAPKAMARGLNEFVQGKVLPLAKERTPVDYGTLRDSGIAEEPKILTNGVVRQRVGFGGAAASYAVYVHEDLDAKHEVGQAKFLESALNDTAPDFPSEVGANIKRAMGM